MRILILGAGKMGSFFTDVLSFDHECAVYEIDAKRMRFLYNTQRFTSMQEIEDFKPELVINAVTLKYTIDVFKQVLPHLPKDCIISDISSVKTGFKEYYDTTEHTDTLKDLRKEIDEIDNDLIDLLAKRMRVCRNIGEYKKENGMTIVQTRRYSEILDKRGAQGSLLGIDTVCIKNIFEHIHEESVRQQMEIINRQ